MFNGKAILRFALVLVGLAGLLLYPWPGAERVYASLFRSGSNVLFSRFWAWPDGSVRFLDLRSPDLRGDIDRVTPGTLPRGFEPPPATGVLDTVMVLRNRKTPANFGMLRIGTRAFGYWSTAWLVALVLAKRMSWRRRGRALVWGLIWLHIFIAFRLTVKLVADGFAARKVYALFAPSEFWKGALNRIEEVVVENPTASFVVPTFIWFLVAFTWQEWASFRRQLAGEPNDDRGTRSA